MRRLLWVACVLLAATAFAPESAGQKPAPLPPSPFGICGLKPRYGKDIPEVWDVTTELGNYMEDAGFRWDRAEIAWPDVQPAPGQWDWSFTDKAMVVYKKRAFGAYCLLEGTAAWLTDPPKTDEERAQYADFVYNVVNRYKGTIRAWEIWNEENIPNFWKDPNPRDYALLLKAAYQAAKRADPGCTIITGGTSTVDLGFIRRVLFDNGGWDYCDAVAIHPYSMGGGPWSQGLPELIRMTRAAVTKGNVSKQIWITEVGWTTDTTRESELRQAEFLDQEYALALAGEVRAVFWFTLGDFGERWGLIAGKRNQPDWGYTSTKRAKPGFYAAKHLTERLSPSGKRPTFLGYLPNVGKAVALAFWAEGDPKRPVLILWTPYGVTQAVNLGQKSGLHALDAHGKSVMVENGTIQATEVPVLVTGYRTGVLKNASPRYDPSLRQPGMNLVVNPSMEYADGDDVAFWNHGAFPDQSKAGTTEWGTSGRTGQRSLVIRQATDAAWSSVPIPVWEGKTYTLRAWAKPTDATGENLAILMWYSGNMWTWLSQDVTPAVSGSGDWQEVTVTATAPKDAVIARITLIGKNNTGSVSWDDVTLTEDNPR